MTRILRIGTDKIDRINRKKFNLSPSVKNDFRILTPLTPLCKRGETLMKPEDSSSSSPLCFTKRGVVDEFTDRIKLL